MIWVVYLCGVLVMMAILSAMFMFVKVPLRDAMGGVFFEPVIDPTDKDYEEMGIGLLIFGLLWFIMVPVYLFVLLAIWIFSVCIKLRTHLGRLMRKIFGGNK